MLNLTTEDVARLKLRSGGVMFTEFVDWVLSAQLHAGGLKLDQLHTNLKVTISDGGVDTKIDSGLGSRDVTGWLAGPTIWQFKTGEPSELTEAKLRKEVNKRFAAECLRNGYSYRLCVCDSLTPEAVTAKEKELAEEVESINPKADKPRILTADALARWASRFTGVVLRLRKLALPVQFLDSWGTNIKDVTAKYVPPAGWNSITKSLAEHVDFSSSPTDVCWVLQGEPGVGKTRMVFEALNLAEVVAPGLVVYCNDTVTALTLAGLIVNEQGAFGVLVVDECDLQGRHKLKQLLQGHRSRVRLIAIDNTGERPDSPSPEHWLLPVTSVELESILDANFPATPFDIRRAIVEVTGGYVQLAADMCRTYVLQKAPTLGVPHTVDEYYSRRFDDVTKRVIEAIALLIKVGFRDDVSQELRELAALVQSDADDFVDQAKTVAASSGFVRKAGRYLYVTPAIIAQCAHERGWRRWIADDMPGFMSRMPTTLLPSFLSRVKKSGGKEVRESTGGFFRSWASRLKHHDITELSDSELLLTLVATDPGSFLPTAASLFHVATTEELESFNGLQTTGWGPRRKAIWIAEELAAFPEYFEDSERLLLRLAIQESEPTTGNNATNTWSQLFRIRLSGTSVAFDRRFQLLESRLQSDVTAVRHLALHALGEILNPQPFRMVGTAVVAGRISPPEWRPQSNSEMKNCYGHAVQRLLGIVSELGSDLREEAISIVEKYMPQIAWSGFVGEMRDSLQPTSLTESQRLRILAKVRMLISIRKRTNAADRGSWPEIEKQIADWETSLIPTDLHGRLVAAVSKSRWDHVDPEDDAEHKSLLRQLASEVLSDSGLLMRELPWLSSNEAIDSREFGRMLGSMDIEGTNLHSVLNASVTGESSLLGQGYVGGLLLASPGASQAINQFLDSADSKLAEKVAELSMAGGDSTFALQRTLRLVDEGFLDPRFLQRFSWGIGQRRLSADEYNSILTRFVQALDHPDEHLGDQALLFAWVPMDDLKQLPTHLDLPRTRELLFELVDHSANCPDLHAYYWSKILELLAETDADKAARIGMRAVLSDNISSSEAGVELMARFAAVYPEQVLKYFGEAALDPEIGTRFYFDNFKAIVAALPDNLLVQWLGRNGLEAARKLARHLATPFVDDGGSPIVPSLTEYVLREYESDDQVFHEFCAGVNSFKSYTGDIAGEHEREAVIAGRFKTHSVRRIREWAEYEERASRVEASEWRRRHEEMFLE